MFAKVWPVATLTLATLSFGPSFAHALEAAPRLTRWPAQLWIDATVLHGQFALFRLIGGPIDVAAILAAAALAWRFRGERGFGAAVTGAVFMALALVAWFGIVAPANDVLATWRPGPPPPEFAAVRNRWEAGHMTVAALKFIGVVALHWALAARAWR